MKHNLQTYCICFLLLAGLMMACGKQPKGVLSEKEMQKVLTDMLIAESLAGTNYQTFKGDTLKMAVYESVFRKHKITQEVYDSSLVWYGKNIDVYMRVYDKVLADINKQLNDLGDIQANAAPVSSRDSVDIWPRRNYMTWSPKSVFNGVAFDIKPESNYSSGSVFVLGMSIWGMPADLKQKPEYSLSAVHRDTTITTRGTIDNDGSFEAILRTTATKQVRRVYGYIRFDSQDTTYHKIYVDGIRLVKYNYGTTISGHTEE